MEEREQQIVQAALEVFMRLGIKSVTMDDMARNLGVSKKTLYQFVSDKNELVNKALNCSCVEEVAQMDSIVNKGLNAIDENFEMSQMIVGQLKNIHPSIHFDLEKYHPEIWSKFQKEHSARIYMIVSENLRKGIKEGLYRKDLNVPVLAKIYMFRFDVVFDPEVFPPREYDFAEVYLEMMRYHIRGIASEKGIEYLRKKVKKEHQNR